MKSKLLLITLLASSLVAKWNVEVSKDVMTEEKTCYVSSNYVKPMQRMYSPYQDAMQFLGIGMNSKGNVWAYMGHNNSPNLTDDKTESGYSSATRRVKFDSEILEMSQTQDWGERFIHFSKDTLFIDKLAKSKNLITELEWHGQGTVNFEHTLKGFKESYNKARAKCGLISYEKDLAIRNKYQDTLNEIIYLELEKYLDNDFEKISVSIYSTSLFVSITSNGGFSTIYESERAIEKQLSKELSDKNMMPKDDSIYLYITKDDIKKYLELHPMLKIRQSTIESSSTKDYLGQPL